MNKETLIKKLSLLKKQDESLKIYIRGDKTLDYGKVMALMGDINKAGFKKIALVTELN